MNKRILILCPFPEGEAAGQRLKYEQYFSSWKNDGYNIDISSFSDQSLWKVLYKEKNLGKKIFGAIKGYLRRVKDLFMVSNYDIVYIFMWVTPYGSTFFERTVRSLSKVLVYDFNDSIHLE
nr:glycosyltransferase [SAR86 cluster bacterium]